MGEKDPDDFLVNVLIGVGVFVLILGVSGAVRSCGTADDIKTVVCVEVYQRAVTASDTLRVHRTTKCDIPARDQADDVR